ncbi:outer membrane beta-barrel protein [Pedobacter sp. MW01-1-1]|uniref:outer membrane beta-barrel protein n=1 Tax=Pedobacter sp. MW01-1-1 TaxID=3383027 RepID=UPI003FED6557
MSKPIVGATVRLVSTKDTLSTVTNAYGYWGFKNVKSADFLISIKALGHQTYNRKYFNNDTKSQINVPPIRLGAKEEQLSEVTISGMRGPKIKGDTTEFWAKDYVVRDYARLEDLLKRMEGITIDEHGSVFYNGERVVKALFNNSQYFNGSTREAIKELPADIVERIQIIDQNETANGAKRTKTEQSVKVLNIVTKADKSAGKMYDFKLEEGTENRMNVAASIKKIDAMDQFAANAYYTNEVLGLPDSPVPGTIANQSLKFRSGGQLTDGRQKTVTAGLSKNHKIAKINFNTSYAFNWMNVGSSVQKVEENFYEEGSLYSSNNRINKTETINQTLNSYFNGKFNQTSSINGNFSASYQRNNADMDAEMKQSGIINNIQNDLSRSKGHDFKYTLNGNYTKKLSPKLELRSTINSSLNNNAANERLNTDIFSVQNMQLVPDSSIHQLKDVENMNTSNSLRNSLYWTKSDRLKMNGGIELSNRSSVRSIEAYLQPNDEPVFQPNLSNYQSENLFAIPLYVSAEYSITSQLSFSTGLTLKNQWLHALIDFKQQTINRSDVFLEPNLHLNYLIEKVGQFDFSVAQGFQQPSATQLNTNPYYVTPYTIQIGNSDLKNAKQKIYTFRYSNFFTKIRFNMSMSASFTFRDNSVTSNRFVQIDPIKNTLTTINKYENIDGTKAQNYSMNLSKNLNKLKTSLSFSGLMRISATPYYANNKVEILHSKNANYSLSMLLSSLKWLDLTPEIQYTNSQDENSLSSQNQKNFNSLLSMKLKAGIFLPKGFVLHSNVSQVINQSSSLAKLSPFVVNAAIEKRIFKAKNGIISFVMMDLANQNKLYAYSSSNLGYSNTATNTDSRYFLLQFSWSPQLWGKSKYDTGRGRRGDGSFIEKVN